jgi:UDP-N-acetylglucosamine--N-acetylmuramyl-(pentapeptide) pyrophosphoryl-undecaprenol N-acetylglucosamine transferase
MARVADHRESRCRDRATADHGSPVAIRLFRRVVTGDLPNGGRHPDLHRQVRASRTRCTSAREILGDHLWDVQDQAEVKGEGEKDACHQEEVSAVRIVIAGGGTAGHVFPAVALGQELASRGHDLLFVGTDRGLEVDLVPDAGFDLEVLHVEPFPRKISPRLITAPVSLMKSVKASHRFVADAGVVVGMGGYASAPPVLAASRGHIPIVLHEQNAIPGAANRFLSRRAREVAITFAESASGFKAATVHTGNPVRRQVLAAAIRPESLRGRACEALGLDAGRRTLVVLGGSQGAVHVNQAATAMCRMLADRDDLQVLVLTGRSHVDQVRSQLPSGALRVGAVGFLQEIELAYAIADLIIARAGATSIAELTTCGIPSVLIPYPHATANHQEANARALEKAGGAEVILDGDLTPEVLTVHVQRLLGEEGVLSRMAGASKAFGRPGAATAVADLVEASA